MFLKLVLSLVARFSGPVGLPPLKSLALGVGGVRGGGEHIHEMGDGSACGLGWHTGDEDPT